MKKKTTSKSLIEGDEYIVSRIRNVLRRQVEASNLVAVAEKIREVNGGGEKPPISRRKLSALCHDEDISTMKLSISQLIALDKYFMSLDEGPLFARNRNLVDAIAESSTVEFYVAEKNLTPRYSNAVSADDVGSITEMLNTRLSRLNIKLKTVSRPSELQKSKIAHEKVAIIGIASPIANPASDAFFTNMLGLDKARAVGVDKLPFFFVRRPGEKTMPSKFVRVKLDAVKRDAEAADAITKGRRAVVVENRVFVDSDKTDYALLVAQRNPNGGHVRVVLAGLAGRGTLELARVLRAGGPRMALPDVRKGEKHPAILVAVYRVTFEGARSKKAPDTRPVAGCNAVYGPRFLHYSDGFWRSPADLSEGH